MNRIEKMSRRAAMARGDEPVELVLTNCKIVNVFNGKIVEGNIAIDQGKVIGIGHYEGTQTLDMKGRFVAPGLIDAHMHLESTLVAPDQLARIVVPQGTTTIIADPHEIANVLGIAGIEYMIEASEHTPMNVFFMLPSCVPATPFENAGAILERKELETLISHPKVLGLGEMMNYPGVIGGDFKVLDKLAMAERLIVDGHGPELTGKDLNAYVINGIRTEHECTTLQEMEERIGLGMYIAIREGSAARNLEALVKGVNERTKYQCMFCSDDKHPEDLMSEGHMNYNVKRSIELGLDPITAIQMATINAARCYNLRDIGAIAPGYDADLIVLESLETFEVVAVFKRGVKVAQDGIALFEPIKYSTEGVKNTVNIGNVDASLFKLKLESDLVSVISITAGSIITKHVKRRVYQDKDNYFKSNHHLDVIKIAVLERHQNTGNVGIGLVENFNLKNGAIATTISHDSHNIIVLGDNDEDMALAVNTLKAIQGGIVVVKQGEILGKLELPIAGLMSEKSMEIVSNQLRELREFAYNDLNIPSLLEPFMTLSFLALPVIPELKITDRGLFDVQKFNWVSLCETT